MKQTVLGIDISKKDFHVVLMTEDTTTKPKVFKNQPQGFESLQTWLSKQGVRSVHACLEATSTYGEALAEFLYEAGHKVSVVNPSRIKGFAKSELIRTKTDQVDAAVIARFCPCDCTRSVETTSPRGQGTASPVATAGSSFGDLSARAQPLRDGYSDCSSTNSSSLGLLTAAD